MSEILENLITATPRLWRGDSTVGSAVQALPTGFCALDHVLPGGGWPLGAMVELLVPTVGIGELRLAAPALRSVTSVGHPICPLRPRWSTHRLIYSTCY